MMKSKEIGSEFWEVECKSTYVISGKTYLAGRTALTAIILDIKSKGVCSVGLPDYCCRSMIEPFMRQDIKIIFYSVQNNETGIFFSFDKLDDFDAVMLVNYFGFMSGEIERIISKCHKAGKIVILDQTHAVFSDKKYSADYIFGSYRKWTGIEIGFASAQKVTELKRWTCNSTGLEYLALRKKARKIKEEFVSGEYRDENQRSAQLHFFNKAEEFLDEEYFSDTDEENKHLLKTLDAKLIRKRRNKNAKVIYEYLNELKICKPMFPVLSEDIVPLVIPVLVIKEKRDSLRSFLQAQGVFCPVHWPLSDLHRVDKAALDIYKSEISLICDQRYNELDMIRMMESVKKWEIRQFV